MIIDKKYNNCNHKDNGESFSIIWRHVLVVEHSYSSLGLAFIAGLCAIFFYSGTVKRQLLINEILASKIQESFKYMQTCRYYI